MHRSYVPLFRQLRERRIDEEFAIPLDREAIGEAGDVVAHPATQKILRRKSLRELSWELVWMLHEVPEELAHDVLRLGFLALGGIVEVYAMEHELFDRFDRFEHGVGE